MKKIKLVISIVLLCFCLFGCDSKWPENGKLDGMWQLMEIDWAGVENKTPTQTYYSIQLKLINLRQVGGSDILGYFRYTGDSLHLTMRQTTIADVKQFGLSDTIQSFGVETLNHSQMILTTPDRRLTFRKY